MAEIVEIDAEGLYVALMDHFGTSPFGWAKAALGQLETLYETGDFDGIIELALDEGFDLDEFIM